MKMDQRKYHILVNDLPTQLVKMDLGSLHKPERLISMQAQWALAVITTIDFRTVGNLP